MQFLQLFFEMNNGMNVSAGFTQNIRLLRNQ